MIADLSVNQSAFFIVSAKELYSEDMLFVKKGEEYEFYCDKDQHWKDLFISTGPDGYTNPLASLAGLRVKRAKYFCLCGVYDTDDNTSFIIGSGCIVHIERLGMVSFFANDTKGFFGNNSGSIKLNVTRLQ